MCQVLIFQAAAGALLEAIFPIVACAFLCRPVTDVATLSINVVSRVSVAAIFVFLALDLPLIRLPHGLLLWRVT